MKELVIKKLIPVITSSLGHIVGSDDFEDCMLHTCDRQLKALSCIYNGERSAMSGETLCTLIIESLKHLDTDGNASIEHKNTTLALMNVVRDLIRYH